MIVIADLKMTAANTKKRLVYSSGDKVSAGALCLVLGNRHKGKMHNNCWLPGKKKEKISRHLENMTEGKFI